MIIFSDFLKIFLKKKKNQENKSPWKRREETVTWWHFWGKWLFIFCQCHNSGPTTYFYISCACLSWFIWKWFSHKYVSSASSSCKSRNILHSSEKPSVSTHSIRTYAHLWRGRSMPAMEGVLKEHISDSDLRLPQWHEAQRNIWPFLPWRANKDFGQLCPALPFPLKPSKHNQRDFQNFPKW